MLQRSIDAPPADRTKMVQARLLTLVSTNFKAWQWWHMPRVPHIQNLLFVAIVAVNPQAGRLFSGLPPLPRGAFCGVCGSRGSCGIATPIPPIRIYICSYIYYFHETYLEEHCHHCHHRGKRYPPRFKPPAYLPAPRAECPSVLVGRKFCVRWRCETAFMAARCCRWSRR